MIVCLNLFGDGAAALSRVVFVASFKRKFLFSHIRICADGNPATALVG